MVVAKPLAALHRLNEAAAQYFIPHFVAKDREAANQARMFLVSHLFGPPLGISVPLAFYAVDPKPGFDLVVLSASILGFWAFPFLLKAGCSYRSLVLCSLLNLNFAIYWSIYHYGGVHSPTLVWLLIIPILSVFYIGGDDQQKGGLFAAAAVAAVVFAAAYFGLDPGPNDVPKAAMEVLGATSAVAVMCYIAVMAIYYARIFDAGVDLEREVARRRIMATELRRAAEAADRAASVKSEFLARMSHELRSPLNAIIGYGELLREECEEDSQDLMQEDLARILEAGAYLMRLIDMILDLAKLDAGKMRFDLRPHDLGEIIAECVANVRPIAEQNGNEISVSVAPDLPEIVADAQRLSQVLESIVGNAAIHTRNGRIEIVARPIEIDTRPSFEVEVRDTGCGIAPEILPSIFETFLVERAASDGRYGGTGLALSLSSKLCRAMGGEISATSQEGEGSVFTVALPAQGEQPQQGGGPAALSEAA